MRRTQDYAVLTDNDVPTHSQAPGRHAHPTAQTAFDTFGVWLRGLLRCQ